MNKNEKAPLRYSSIQDWHKCQTYFKHKHIDGLPDPSMENNGDLSFGTAMHLGVQDLLESGNGLDMFNMYWEMECAKPLKFGRLDGPALAKLGRQLLEIFRDEHMDKFKPVHLEQKFTGTVGAHPYSGTADNIGDVKLTKAGEWVASVVDWKTSATPYNKYKIIVNEQMYGYAHLVYQKLGYEAKQVVYAVAVKDPKNPRWQFKAAPISLQIVTKKLANVEQVCDAIQEATDKNVFARNPLQCVTGSYGNERVCPYFNKCHKDVDSGEEDEKA